MTRGHGHTVLDADSLLYGLLVVGIVIGHKKNGLARDMFRVPLGSPSNRWTDKVKREGPSVRMLPGQKQWSPTGEYTQVQIEGIDGKL